MSKKKYAIVEPKTGITVAITKKHKISESGVVTDDTGRNWYGHEVQEINANMGGQEANDCSPDSLVEKPYYCTAPGCDTRLAEYPQHGYCPECEAKSINATRTDSFGGGDGCDNSTKAKVE